MPRTEILACNELKKNQCRNEAGRGFGSQFFSGSHGLAKIVTRDFRVKAWSLAALTRQAQLPVLNRPIKRQGKSRER